ncbi:hypothetical protein RYX36_007637, partial [Vicia faba]
MDSSHSSSGEIYLFVGPMFAGKTTSLLRRIKSEVDNGKNMAMLKSSKDNRYAVDAIVTHDGIKFPCRALPDLMLFKDKFGHEAYQKLDVIGLDGDYLRRSFGSVLHIIPIADTVTKLTARCELCGKRAFFTLRKTEEKQTELIGGADLYMSVCRQHYVNGQVFFLQKNLEENEAANKKFEQASTKSSYVPKCQIFHLKSLHSM